MKEARMKVIRNTIMKLSREDYLRNEYWYKVLPPERWSLHGTHNKSGQYKEEVFWEVFNALEEMMEE